MASEHPVMPVDLFMAAIEGNRDVLIPRLGLQPEEPTDQIQVTIEATHSSPQQINTELQSATGFGDTVLHVLVTYGHNVLALKVFQRDRSLLNAQNKMSETPLHCAAKVANCGFMGDLIAFYPVIVRDAMNEIDENGDTPFHVAAKHGHVDVIRKLMEWDSTIAHRVNNEILHIAIMKNYTRMVKEMLEVDRTRTLTYIPFSDGMFPVHVSACMGNIELVKHFIEQYPNCAKLLDPRGRNLFHIAAEKNQPKIFTDLFKDTNMGQMMARMNNATDNEGNTPLHIAAMKGHKSIIEAIWEKKKVGIDAENIQNNEGLTPFKLSARQLKTNEYIDDEDIESHESIVGSKFSQDWFDIVMNPAFTKNKWEKTQVLGLGSVLITTVTFAAAFTIPGGYNQNDGTPVLGKKYMFRAFIIANTFAFIKGIASLVVLLWETKDIRSRLRFAAVFFMLAVSYMMMAFGFGMYVTLAPICYPIAVIVLVIILITGSPVWIYYVIVESGPKILVHIVSRVKTAKGRIIFLVLFWFTLFPLIFLWALA